MEKNIFIFDKNRCVGCHACIVACVNENGFQYPEQWRNVLNSNSENHPDLPVFYLSLACNHCDDAPCLKACPANAFYHDPNTGAVIHEEEKCIGCNYCSWLCPYDAPKYIHSTGVIEKCTFCIHRIEKGLKPSCADLCPVGALDFTKESFSKEEALLSSPVPVMIGSSLKVIELRNPVSPKLDEELFRHKEIESPLRSLNTVIKVNKEWPLIAFTLISSFLLGFYTSDYSKFPKALSEILLPVLGILAVFLSLIHLGKKTRAWRSVLNIQNSWLSREILFFIFFLLSIFSNMFLGGVPKGVIAINGILLMISIDFLYLPVQWKWKTNFHSGQVLLIAISFWLYLSGNPVLFLSIITIRLFLLFFRILNKDAIHRKKFLITGIKLLLVFISAWSIIIGRNEAIGIVSLIIFDVLERIDFYKELTVPRPQL